MIAPQTGSQSHVEKDFSHLWIGGRMIVTGHADQLYDPDLQERVYRDAHPEGHPPALWLERNRNFGGFFYPPPAAVAYAALAWMPMGIAAIAQAYLNIAIGLLAAWYFSRQICGRGRLPEIALAILLYPAFFITVSLGQNSVMTMALIMVAWGLCNRRSEFLAGLLLGVLVCKPNWLLALVWIPLIHQRWRVLAGMICGSAVILAGSVLIVGIKPLIGYFELLGALADLHEMPGYNLHLTYNGLSFFRKLLGEGQLVELLGWGSSAMVVMTTWLITRGQWKPGTVHFQRLMGCCLMGSLWVNPHLFYYDLTLSIPCIVLMSSDWRELDWWARIRMSAIVLLSFLAIPVDDWWSLSNVLPLPSIATLAVWMWFCCRIINVRRVEAQPVRHLQPT